MFEFTSLSNIELRAGGSLLKNFVYANQDERNYVEQVFGFARSKNTRVHLLKENDNPLGFVALSLRNFNDVPSPHISDPPLRVSEYLLGQAISMANNAWSVLPLRYMALNLADDSLEQLYSQYGFYRVEGAGSWMVLVLPAT